MRLSSFRILRSFGFADSGEVALDPPGGIVFLLGRNSSGKTSFLQALRHFEYGVVPSHYKNFSNFNPVDKASWLIARFTIENGDLDVDRMIKNIAKKLLDLRVPEEAFDTTPKLKELVEVVKAQYQLLFDTLLSSEEVSIHRNASGNYFFLPSSGNTDALEKRKSIINRSLHVAFPGEKLNYAGREISASITFQQIEDELFREFPPIIFFGDSYRLNDDLPDRITESSLQSPQNKVEMAFLEFLGKGNLTRFMVANDPDERESILENLRLRAKLLCDSVNKQAAALSASPGLLNIILHEKDGLQITIKADEKKSFYRHLSDNTKILLSYHLHALVEEIENNILLFDEPSTGFHPSAQAYLLEFFQSLATRGNQVILSTHSEYMIDLDTLSGVRLMSSDKNGTLKVENHPYKHSRSRDSMLALQPLLDAIGLRYGMGLSLGRNVVLTEGITDLLYLRALNHILGIEGDLAIAPTRSDAHMMTLLPFFFGQGIGIRLLIDRGGLREKIQQEYGIPDEFVFEVPVPEQFQASFKGSGIEDLFSKSDFERLAKIFEVDLGDRTKVETTPNSNVMRKHPGKRIIAHNLLASVGTTEWKFDEETKANFTRALDFCVGPTWFRL